MKRVLHIVQWLVAAFLAIFSVVGFTRGGAGILSGLLLLAGAFLISPLPDKIPAFGSISKGKAVVQIVGCFALFIIGIVVSPASPNESSETVERSMPEIVETEQTTTTTAETTTNATESETETSTTPAEKAIADKLSDTTTAAETTTTTETTTTAKPTTTTKATTKKKKTTTKPKPTTTTTTTTEETTTTTTTTAQTTTTTEKKSMSYVANTNTMKFHYPSCSSVEDIQPGNRWDFTGDRAELIAQGYQPCKRCNP